METSFNFGGFRENLSKEIKDLRDEDKREKARQILEKAKEDIRYQISSELHKLGKEVKEDSPEDTRHIEGKESLPANWERVDISEKIPEWLRLLVDSYRIYFLKRKVSGELPNDQSSSRSLKSSYAQGRLESLIICTFFENEVKENILKQYHEWLGEYEPAGKKKIDVNYQLLKDYISRIENSNLTELLLRHDFTKRTTYDVSNPDDIEHYFLDGVAQSSMNVCSKVIGSFLEDISDGRYSHEGTSTDSKKHWEGPYSHGVSGYFSHLEKTPNYILAHTNGAERLFDLDSPIKKSYGRTGYLSENGKIWVIPGSNQYISLLNPIVIFTKENPAFSLALENEGHFDVGSERMINLNLPKAVLEKSIEDGIITSIEPTWADFADEVIDLVRGEILRHRYK